MTSQLNEDVRVCARLFEGLKRASYLINEGRGVDEAWWFASEPNRGTLEQIGEFQFMIGQLPMTFVHSPRPTTIPFGRLCGFPSERECAQHRRCPFVHLGRC